MGDEGAVIQKERGPRQAALSLTPCSTVRKYGARAPGGVNTLLKPATRREEIQKCGRVMDAESDPPVSCL